jgi:hypothetical protein
MTPLRPSIPGMLPGCDAPDRLLLVLDSPAPAEGERVSSREARGPPDDGDPERQERTESESRRSLRQPGLPSWHVWIRSAAADVVLEVVFRPAERTVKDPRRNPAARVMDTFGLTRQPFV